MNNQTARRIRRIAAKISPEGSGVTRRSGTKIVKVFAGLKPDGTPNELEVPVKWETVSRTGTRHTYKNLKRQVARTPRNLRGQLLEALESYK